MLEILYRDEHLIAINKPSGLLVHKSFYSGEADTYAIQELRKQIENEVKQNAITYYRRLQTSEIDLPFLKHQTSRYCLVEAIPETGRFHQLRKHFKHILHPILGCRKHGCNKQNKLWLQTFDINKMTLHAHQLTFNHPVSNERITVNATIDDDFKKVGEILNFDLSTYS